MYQFSYADIMDESPVEGRVKEREALMRAIELMREADEAGPKSVRAVTAVFKNRQLWSLLIDDAARPDNELSPALRAQIISIGLWALRELEDIRSGKSRSFKDLIEVTKIIAEGLQ